MAASAPRSVPTRSWWDKAMSASRHIRWCKEQAYTRIAAGDLQGALDQFLSDMRRGLDTQISTDPKAGQVVDAQAAVAAGDAAALRAWIDSFEEPAVVFATGAESE